MRLLGLLVGVIGVAAVVGLDAGHTSGLAVVELLLVAVGYSTAPIIANRMLSDVPTMGVIALSLTGVAVAYLPAALLAHPHVWPRANVVASVLVLALVCTALAFLIFFQLIAEIGPIRATVITFVNPAVAVLLGVSILGEPFTSASRSASRWCYWAAGSRPGVRRPPGAARRDEPEVRRPDAAAATLPQPE